MTNLAVLSFTLLARIAGPGIIERISNLNPIMFTVGPLSVRWYGFFMAIAIAVGFYTVLTYGPRYGFDEDSLTLFLPLAVIGGLAGARLIYVLTNLDFYIAFPAEIPRIDHGGLSIHGAALGGALVGWLFVRWKGWSFNQLADLVVPGFVVGIALVRIANLINEEIAGRFSSILGGLHPAQIYGSLIGVVLLIYNYWLARKPQPAGTHFWGFVLWYSVLRGAIEETFRANPLYLPVFTSDVLGVGFFTLTHLVTPIFIGLALWQLALIRQIENREDD